MNILFIILDGLADRPQATFGGKTPLEAARAPHLDRLAELGSTGLLMPFAPGVPLESEFSHFLLFGYPQEKFPGRAAFEAIGRGIEVPFESVVLLASFATTTLIENRVRRDTILWEEKRCQDEADCEKLSVDIATYEAQGIRFLLQPCGHCEGILTLFGSPSRYVSDVDPFYNGTFVVRALPLEEDSDQHNAERTATALNEYLSWVHLQLQSHSLNHKRQMHGLPAINFLLTKWAAIRPQVPSFLEQNGMRAASVENHPLYIGLARVCGMTSITVPPHSNIEKDFSAKLRVAEELFQQGYEFIHVHSKGPDIAAHRKDPVGKRETIEAIDRVLGPLVHTLTTRSDLLVVITGDHATPSSGPLIHSGEAIPLLVAGGPNVLADDVKEFHERAVVHGGLGRVYGPDLMPILLNFTDRVGLYGVRHQRQARSYWQWNPVEPFTISRA
jgi:2,3-bisphosphoglycerate-independent phosphoglycerate mutase